MLARLPGGWASVVTTVAIALLLLAPGPLDRSGGLGGTAIVASLRTEPTAGPTEGAASSLPLSALLSEPLGTISGASELEAPPAATPAQLSEATALPLLLTLAFQNASRLDSLVAAIEDPSSTHYHHYLSSAEFTAEFAPNASEYGTILEYLASFGVEALTAYPNRLTVSFEATPAEARAIFHASITGYLSGGSGYWALAGPPEWPTSIAPDLAAVSGLGPMASTVVEPLAGLQVLGPVQLPVPPRSDAPPAAPSAGGSLAPVQNGSVQYLYPADLQVGYDEESLFDLYGYPRTATVASLDWAGTYEGTSTVTTDCGSLAPGGAVGPYDPADLGSYFSTALPAGEPTPTVVDVPVDGSPAANCTASYDSTGVVAANTAQLEVVGSLAPGSTVYAVSAPGPSITELEHAFATVLSPPATLSVSVRDGLENVSVVEVGWATNDTMNTTWFSDLAQAEARGITVVAAVGDSADYSHSPSCPCTNAEFPASAANNTVGSLAVGGTTTVLNGTTDHLASQSVWNVSATDTLNGGPAGSAGGISAEYPEPSFQANTSANAIVQGLGRGLPDVAAVANNSLVTITIKGTQFQATNASLGKPSRAAHGTGIAAAYVAGLLAEIDYTLRVANGTRLGFVDPTVYALGNEEYSAAPSGAGVTSMPTGSYDSALPTTPFVDVVAGHNAVYYARTGFDLVSGWGSIDAYNLTMYVLHPSETGVPGALAALREALHLTGASVTSHYSTGRVDRSYNASIQQAFFLANSLGAPVYWGQSVVYLTSTVGGAWSMNFTAWLTYPFPSMYPELAIHEDWFPASGQTRQLPLSLSLTSRLVPPSGTTPPELVFTFGPPGSPTLTLHAPGAAFIIGRANYSYSWQGTEYTNGPRTGGSSVGYLAPQLLLVGGPPNATGDFGPGTAGNLTATVQPSGSTVFAPARLGVLNASDLQTLASARNVSYSITGNGAATFAYLAGGAAPGVYAVEAPYYAVTFGETGVPDGSTWYVNLTSGIDLSGTGSSLTITTALENGTYGWTATIDVRNWSAVPSSGTLTVAGTAMTVSLVFGPAFGTLTFKAKGPEVDGRLKFDWYVNITGQAAHDVGNGTTYTTNLSFGTYTYHIACTDPGYVSSKPSGTVVVGVTTPTVDFTFDVRTFPVVFVFKLPSQPPRLTISFAGLSESGSFGTWTIDEPNGSYSWSISGMPLGYTASPSGGTVVVHGPVTPIVVTIHEGGWGPFGLGIVGYVLVGVAGGLAALWTAVLLWRRSRHRRAEEVSHGRAKPARPARRSERRPPHGPRDVSPEDL